VTPSNGVLSFRLYRLGSIQLDSLRDKGEFRTENASDITLEDAPAPCVGISENVKMCDPFFEANQDAILKATDRLYRHPNTPEVMRSNLDDFRPWASDVLKRAGCPGDGWEARLDILLAGNVCRSGSEEMDVPLAP
jgi:hypothetical protein